MLTKTRDSSKTVGDLFKEGMEAWRRGQWEPCRASLSAAWSLEASRRIASNLAACEIKLGRYRDAAEHLSFLLRSSPGEKPMDLSAEQRRWLDDAVGKVGAIDVEAEAGATVLVDGQAVGQAPLGQAVYLEPGKHVLEARPERGAVARVEVVAVAGKREAIVLRAVEAPPERSVPEPVRAAPVTRLPPSEQRLRNLVMIGELGLGGATLVTGVVFAVVSKSKSDTAESSLSSIIQDGGAGACFDASFKGRCDALDDAYIAQGTTRNLAIASFVTAGVAFGGAALTYALWPRVNESKPSGLVMPVVAPGFAGVGVAGTF